MSRKKMSRGKKLLGKITLNRKKSEKKWPGNNI